MPKLLGILFGKQGKGLQQNDHFYKKGQLNDKTPENSALTKFFSGYAIMSLLL